MDKNGGRRKGPRRKQSKLAGHPPLSAYKISVFVSTGTCAEAVGEEKKKGGRPRRWWGGMGAKERA